MLKEHSGEEEDNEQENLVREDEDNLMDKDEWSRSKRRRYALAGLVFFMFILIIAVASRSGSSTEDIPPPGTSPTDDDDDGSSTSEDDESGPSDPEALEAMIFKMDPKDEETYIKHFADECASLKAKQIPQNSVEYKVAAANCGWGYDWTNSSAKHDPWKIYLHGSAWQDPRNVELSGCPIGPLRCPMSPQCQILISTEQKQLSDANVVMVFQSDADALARPVKSSKWYSVLNWRYSQEISPSIATQKLFDFEMGAHYFAENINPAYLKTPSMLMLGSFPPFAPLPVIPFEDKASWFAISAVSECHAPSLRDQYIDELIKILGSGKVHRLGKCGATGPIPRKPFNNFAKLIAQYKFFFAFEDTIQGGYATDKLFTVLALPTLPVFYGAPNMPNVTSVPSFINVVADFKSPASLARYLIFLDQNPDQYSRYHMWRNDASLFTDDFLRTMTLKVAGPEEQLAHLNSMPKAFSRASQCCRLCDENFVKWATHERKVNKQQALVTTMNSKNIIAKLFDGGIH